MGKLPVTTNTYYLQFPATTNIIFSTLNFFLITFLPLAYDMTHTHKLVMTCDNTSLNTVLKACLMMFDLS